MGADTPQSTGRGTKEAARKVNEKPTRETDDDPHFGTALSEFGTAISQL